MFENYRINFQSIADRFSGTFSIEQRSFLKILFEGSPTITVVGTYEDHNFRLRVVSERMGGGSASIKYFYVEMTVPSKIRFFKVFRKRLFARFFNESLSYDKSSKLAQEVTEIRDKKYLVSSDELGTVNFFLHQESVAIAIANLMRRFELLEVTSSRIHLTKSWSSADSKPSRVTDTLAALHSLSKALEL